VCAPVTLALTVTAPTRLRATPRKLIVVDGDAVSVPGNGNTNTVLRAGVEVVVAPRVVVDRAVVDRVVDTDEEHAPATSANATGSAQRMRAVCVNVVRAGPIALAYPLGRRSPTLGTTRAEGALSRARRARTVMARCIAHGDAGPRARF
jgi:hypothetical protein